MRITSQPIWVAVTRSLNQGRISEKHFFRETFFRRRGNHRFFSSLSALFVLSSRSRSAGVCLRSLCCPWINTRVDSEALSYQLKCQTVDCDPYVTCQYSAAAFPGLVGNKVELQLSLCKTSGNLLKYNSASKPLANCGSALLAGVERFS